MSENANNPTEQRPSGDGAGLSLPGPGAEEQTTPIVVADEAEDGGSAIPYPIVGIGASAGGVEAYIELFTGLAPDTGMAFVVVPHLLADHKSHLVDILGRHTPMPVAEIIDGTRPERDHVYVLPPGV